MAGIAVAQARNTTLRSVEFYAFCVTSFSLKSLLLIGLPYREWPVNTVYTVSLLVFFYCFFRFRQGLRAPVLVIISLILVGRRTLVTASRHAANGAQALERSAWISRDLCGVRILRLVRNPRIVG